MVDVKNRVFTNVKTYVNSKYPKVNCQNSRTFSKPDLPALAFEQIDNSEVAVDLDKGEFDDEVAVQSAVEIQVYSNKDIMEASEIINVASDAMRAMNYTRTYGAREVVVAEQRDMHRMVARYQRIIHNIDDIPKFDLDT